MHIKVLTIIKYITFIQLSLIIGSIVIYYFLRIYLQYREKKLVNIEQKMIALLESNLNLKLDIAKPTIRFFRRNLIALLHGMRDIEKRTMQPKHWEKTKQQISHIILKPQARKLVCRRKWTNKFTAVLCYEYGIDECDTAIISKLIHSDILLIALNAARIIFAYPNERLINTLINTHAQESRMQQYLYAEILAAQQLPHIDMIISTILIRLEGEQNPYTKAFCYRTLSLLKANRGDISQISKDVYAPQIELKIAAINYLACIKAKGTHQILLSLLDDERMEVRAVVANVIARYDEESTIVTLEKKLRDPAWWVRINAANALKSLGEQGMQVLKRQSPKVDQFAYEVAQKVLRIHEHQKIKERDNK